MNYKGMDQNMQCRGFQYEVGKEYEHTGPLIQSRPRKPRL